MFDTPNYRREEILLDWDDLRFFLAVVRNRTLADAARHLHVTSSTVGRRLETLQKSMGVRLVQRSAESHTLTLAGEVMRTHAERVEQEMSSLKVAIANHDVRLDGLVRVASPTCLLNHVFAPAFAALQARHPGILIEALPEPERHGSPPDDVDIVVQFQPFEQTGSFIRSIGTVAFGFYGREEYLVRHGEPDVGSGCPGHQLVALMDGQDLSAQAAWLADNAGRAQVGIKTNCYENQLWAVLHGGGVALLPRFRADGEPALRRLTTTAAIPSAEIWVGVQHDARQVPRVRTVLDNIVQRVREQAAWLNPAAARRVPA